MKSQSPSQNSSESKTLATRDLKITLGSQVDGMGRFLGSTMASAMERDPLPFSGNVPGIPLPGDDNATRREHYEEIKEEQGTTNWPLTSVDESPSQRTSGGSLEDIENGLVPASTDHCRPNPDRERSCQSSHRARLFKRTRKDHTGYWDLLSIFRSGTGKFAGQSTTNSEKVSRVV